MGVYGAKELAASFRQVRANTIQIAEDIPEDRYGFKAAPDVRSIGQILTHIAIGPGFQMHIHTNRIDDLQKVNFPELAQKLGAEENLTRTKADVIAFLTSEGDRFASYVEGLSDQFLGEPVAMPGAGAASRSRLEMLLSVKEHEMHHRGQLMLLERMIGITPHLTRQMQERTARAQQAAAPGQAR